MVASHLRYSSFPLCLTQRPLTVADVGASLGQANGHAQNLGAPMLTQEMAPTSGVATMNQSAITAAVQSGHPVRDLGIFPFSQITLP